MITCSRRAVNKKVSLLLFLREKLCQVSLDAHRATDKVLGELDLNALLGPAGAFFYYAFYVGNRGLIRNDSLVGQAFY